MYNIRGSLCIVWGNVMGKKISVIIPCFNGTKWLPKCFVSLVQQTIGIENIELIFVNDASTDDGATWNMLTEFERAYGDSVIIINLEENMRQGGARNIGLKYAAGSYIGFVDADDWVAENLFEKTYNMAVENNADIVQFNHSIYFENGISIENKNPMKDEVITVRDVEDRKTLLMSEKITYGCWNKIYKRDLIEKAGVNFAEHVIYEEPLFVYPLLFWGSTFVTMSDSLYVYRQNSSGTMRNDMKAMYTIMEHATVQHEVWKFMKKTSFFDTYYEEIKLYFLHTYLYETLLFAKQRGFEITDEMYNKLREVAKKEVTDMDKSKYSYLIPEQMKLYKEICEKN